MKRLTTMLIVASLLVTVTWLWPSAPAMEPAVAALGPVMKAHFIDVGQANATLLEFQCGVVLIDAGADQEHAHALVEFLNRFFDDRPAFERTIKLVLPSRLPLSPPRGEELGLNEERLIPRDSPTKTSIRSSAMTAS